VDIKKKNSIKIAIFLTFRHLRYLIGLGFIVPPLTHRKVKRVLERHSLPRKKNLLKKKRKKFTAINNKHIRAPMLKHSVRPFSKDTISNYAKSITEVSGLPYHSHALREGG